MVWVATAPLANAATASPQWVVLATEKMPPSVFSAVQQSVPAQMLSNAKLPGAKAVEWRGRVTDDDLKRLLQQAADASVDGIALVRFEAPKARRGTRGAVHMRALSVYKRAHIHQTELLATRAGTRAPWTVDAKDLSAFWLAVSIEVSKDIAERQAKEQATKQEVKATPKATAATDEPTVRRSPPQDTISIDRPAWTHADRLLHVRLGGHVRSRLFRYYDVLTTNLREFNSGVSGGILGAAEAYPWRWKGKDGVVRRLGFAGDVGFDFGQNPTVADAPGTVLAHYWHAWSLGPAVRWDFSHVLLRSTLTFGRYVANFSAPERYTATQELPSVAYQNLRFGLGGRVETTILNMELDLGYSVVRRGGHVRETLFPHAAVGGLDIRAMLSRNLLWDIEVYLGCGYAHFFYSLRPNPGDTHIAGGALDLHFSADVGLLYVL